VGEAAFDIKLGAQVDDMKENICAKLVPEECLKVEIGSTVIKVLIIDGLHYNVMTVSVACAY